MNNNNNQQRNNTGRQPQSRQPARPSGQSGSGNRNRTQSGYPRGTAPARRHPQKKRGIPAWKVVLAVVVVFILLVIGLTATFLKLYKPSVDTDVPFDTDDNTVTSGSDTIVTAPTTEETSAEPDIDTSSDIDGYTRNTDSVNFLVIGRDVSGWNTDVIMIVNFNMKEGSLSVMQIPRDTYVDSDEGNVHGRINTTLSKFYSADRKKNPDHTTDESIKAGMDSFCRFLEKILCIKLDGYCYMNLQGFRGIVDALDGVYVDVPYQLDYEDPDQNLYIHIKPGPQTLNGTQAEGFVRFRSGYVQADIGRADAQKIFLTALFKQVKNSMNVSTIAKLVEQVMTYVLTDVPLADLIIYAKELLGVDMGNISMMTMHGSAIVNERGAWLYVMNRAATLDMINTYFNVYSKPITDGIFDRNQSFNDEDDSIVNEIYWASPDDDVVLVKPDVKTGEEIDDDGITIYIK